MSNAIAIVCEARNDFEVATRLIDGVLLNHVDWIEPEYIDQHRIYIGLTDAEHFVKWQTIEMNRGTDYRRAYRRTFGENLPRHEIDLRIWRVIHEFSIRSSETGRQTPYIVVVKDTDAKEESRVALLEARTQYDADNIVVGMQHTELECWLIAAFEPESQEEQTRLSTLLRGELPGIGFDPRNRSEELTATKKDTEKLSPKRVLDHLTLKDFYRSVTGLSRHFHARLKERGSRNGLADFLSDVEWRLLKSLFNERPRDSRP